MRRSDQRRLAVFALYQNDLTGRELDDLFERDTTEFTRRLAEDVLADRDSIDGVIRDYARDWPLERIAPLERNILRVAIHELRGGGEVPREVAVDEAVELAKRYCSADAPKFVNGILGSVLRDLPPVAANGEEA
ncbi:MAG: transcription antitermination factor NusB [Actinobacteria bacterium]|nr:transcription antitermination factor NusB [Actinomycetota bacterium]